MDMWATFQAIGARIEARWHAVSHDERALPEIAAEALQEGGLDRFGFDEAVKAILSDGPLPVQAHVEAVFGQPPVTVHRGDGFFIELLFWVDGLLSIHRHRFSGAFLVL